MKRIAYFFLYGLLWLITRLPMRFLYLLSDFFYLLVWYVIPYRKKLVLSNMKRSFPAKDERTIRQTARNFYRHLCDSFIEGLVTIFLSDEEIDRRFSYRNPGVCEELFKKGKSIALIMGHYGNWEWSANMPVHIPHKVLAIYKPLHNPYIDRMVRKNREKFGLETVPMEKIFRTLHDYQQAGERTLTMFLADQRPRWAQIQHWITFLNQDTPVILGPEKISEKLGLSVVYYRVNKVKRGHYQAEFIPMVEDPSNTRTFEITENFYRLLEEDIRKHPEYWLWTHKRWKHDKARYKPKAVQYRR